MRWPLFYVYEISLLSRRGEIQKNNSRGGFSGWTRASFAGIGVGAELTHQPLRSK